MVADDGFRRGPHPAARAGRCGREGRQHPTGDSRLRDPQRTGRRRHGRRLSCPAPVAESARRAQDAPLHALERWRPGAVPRRGRGAGPAAASQHHPGVRGRRARRTALLRAGVCHRRQPVPAAEDLHPGTTPRGPAGRTAGRGRPGRARGGHHSPRPQAGQRAAAALTHRLGFQRRPQCFPHPLAYRERRARARQLVQRLGRAGVRAEDIGLRAGQVPRPRLLRRDADGTDPRHSLLHGPGTGPGARPAHRAPRRRVCTRRHPLRDVDRTAALQGRQRQRHPGPRRSQRARSAAAAAARPVGRPGNHLPEVPAQGPAPALRQRPRTGRGPAPVPGEQADPGPADLDSRARAQVGAAQPRRRRPEPAQRTDRRRRSRPGAVAVGRGRRPA